MPESYILKFKNVKRYKNTASLYTPRKLEYEIKHCSLVNSASVAFQAMQFIYKQNYIDEHPELNNKNITIINMEKVYD